MTQENKDLLLKDLCGRLPYNVKLYIEDFVCTPRTLKTVYKDGRVTCEDICRDIEQIKPYLFPMSSMTEEQKEEYCSLQQRVIYNSKGLINSDVMEYVNYCYKNHIDINNLIPKGSAIDATGLNIY